MHAAITLEPPTVPPHSIEVPIFHTFDALAASYLTEPPDQLLNTVISKLQRFHQ